MRKSNWSEEQIIKLLRDREANEATEQPTPLAEFLKPRGVSRVTFYRWRRKYGDMTASEATRLKGLERENGRLKRLVADQALDIQVLKEINAKNW